MSQVDSRLETKIETIAFLWIFFHVVIYTYIGHNARPYQPYVAVIPGIPGTGTVYRVKPSTLKGLIMVSFLELAASILLFVGAKIKKKSLLIPFMLFMVLVCMFLAFMATSGMVACIIGIVTSENLWGKALLLEVVFLILLALAAWMLKTIKKLYNEIRQTDQCEENGISNNFNQRDVIIHDRGPAGVEMNTVPLHVNLPHFNQSNIAPSVNNMPPPQYNEISATPNDGVESPPTYDEAMVQQSIWQWLNKANI